MSVLNSTIFQGGMLACKYVLAIKDLLLIEALLEKFKHPVQTG